MSSEIESVRFTPNPWLLLGWLWGSVIAVTVVSYLWQEYHDEYRWSDNYVYSLAMPCALLPIIFWIAFVPRRLELSNTSLLIQFPFRSIHVNKWSELKYWGQGYDGILRLRFMTGKTFQISLFAFPRSQRRQLTGFISQRFPGYKARLW